MNDKNIISSTTKKGKEKGRKFLREFSAFLNRGNVIDLAVGIVVGGAFQKIVSSLVNDIIMPLLSLIGKQNLSEAKWVLREAVTEGGIVVQQEVALLWGSFMQSVIDFLIIALAIFVAVRAITSFRAAVEKRTKKLLNKKRLSQQQENAPDNQAEPEEQKQDIIE